MAGAAQAQTLRRKVRLEAGLNTAVMSATEFEQLLPWYLNGSLGAGERARVLAYLQAHPEEQARVQWNELLRGAIKRQIDEVPVDIGLARVLLALGGSEQQEVSHEVEREPLPAADRPGEFTQLLQRMRAGYAGARDAFFARVLLALRGSEQQEVSHEVEREPLPAADRPGEFTQLLQRMRAGDAGARDALFALVYEDFKKLAYLRLLAAGRGGLLDTTALVHEAFIRFFQSGQMRSQDRRLFFAFASQVMRSVIVDAARSLAEPLGRGAADLTLSTDDLPGWTDAILEVHEALLVLEKAEPRLARLIEMRYYGGYSDAEIAETLGVTERTVQRDWGKARLLLKAALNRS